MDKLKELNWKIINAPEQAHVVSFKTKGMLKNIEHIEQPNTIWGIPMAYHLVAKQNLWYYLKQYYGPKKAELISPRTFNLKNETDLAQMKMLLEQNEPVVLKTNKQRRKGITIIESTNELLSNQSNDHVVGQALKTNTLNFDERKFHLRFYVAISIVEGKFRAFVYPTSRAVFAKKQAKSLSEKYITHNSNYTTDLPLFGEELLGNTLSKDANSRVEKLLRIALVPYEKVLTSKLKDGKNYYDLFGADILFLENQYPLLIEVNRSPSMNALNKDDEKLKERIISSFLDAVDQNQTDFRGWVRLYM
jgi:hypothetical protein